VTIDSYGKARKELIDLKSLLYKDVLAQIDDISVEIRSLEIGNSSISTDDVEDELTRLSAKFEDMTKRLAEVREGWIKVTKIT
jgi:archaellum component FlaC